MAEPLTTQKLLIKLSNSDSPETFSAPCALTSRSINFSANANEETLPDCSDPELPVWLKRYIDTLSAGVSGSGKLALADLAKWRAWMLSGQPRNIQVVVDEALASGGGHFALAAVLTTFNIGQERRMLATVEVEIQSHGAVAWVDASA